MGGIATVIPMVGFHLDNHILPARGLKKRKGAPETFDIGGLLRLVGVLPYAETVFFQTFDRDRDVTIPAAGEVAPDCETVLVEGNYLLYDAPGWRDLNALWDFSVRLVVPEKIIRQRLIDRWSEHGHTPDLAMARAEGNDLRNAELIASPSLKADATVEDW